jgi:hypothetical protein
LGKNGGGEEKQIDADQSKRRRTAVRLIPISPPAMAGVGRRKSAKAAATRESPELRGVRVSACARGRGRVRPTEPDERLGLGLTHWVPLTGGPRGKKDFS